MTRLTALYQLHTIHLRLRYQSLFRRFRSLQIPFSAPRRLKAKFLKGCLLDNLFSLTPATPFFHKSFVCKIFAEALFFARYSLVAGCFLLSGYNIFSIFLVFSQFIMQEVVNLLARIYNFAAFQTLSYDCTSKRVKLQVLQNIFRQGNI